MKINVSWIGRSPANFTEPQLAAAFLRILFDVMGRVEQNAEFRFVLAGELCVAEYNLAVETEVEPPEEYATVFVGFTGSNSGPVGRHGQPGVEFDLEEDDFKSVLLDSDEISWRA